VLIRIPNGFRTLEIKGKNQYHKKSRSDR